MEDLILIDYTSFYPSLTNNLRTHKFELDGIQYDYYTNRTLNIFRDSKFHLYTVPDFLIDYFELYVDAETFDIFPARMPNSIELLSDYITKYSFKHIYSRLSIKKKNGNLKLLQLDNFIKDIKYNLRKYIDCIEILKIFETNIKTVSKIWVLPKEIMEIIIYYFKNNLIKSDIYESYECFLKYTSLLALPLNYNNLLFINHYKRYVEMLLEDRKILKAKLKKKRKFMKAVDRVIYTNRIAYTTEKDLKCIHSSMQYTNKYVTNRNCKNLNRTQITSKYKKNYR